MNRRLGGLLLRFLALIMSVSLAASAAPTRRIPVVLDTDIGTDIDDSWALVQLLRSPELDLKMVLTEAGDTADRATLAAKFLQIAGRTDVAVAVGLHQAPIPESLRNLAPWYSDYQLANYPGRVHRDGIGAFIRLVMESPVPVTVIAIGPTPTLARALEREPAIAARCRLVGMQGSFDIGYGGDRKPVAESNVKVDPAALRKVLSAPWQDILLTPLDTCGVVDVSGEDYHAIWSATKDPVLRALIESYCVFASRVNWMRCDFFATKSSTLFDCVAIYLAYAEDLTEIEPVRFRVTDKGFTVRDPAGPYQARAALHWKDLPAFKAHLADRILGRAPGR